MLTLIGSGVDIGQEFGGSLAGRFHVHDVLRGQTRRREIGVRVEGQVDGQGRGGSAGDYYQGKEG